jgi:hypothetical protein
VTTSSVYVAARVCSRLPRVPACALAAYDCVRVLVDGARCAGVRACLWGGGGWGGGCKGGVVVLVCVWGWWAVVGGWGGRGGSFASSTHFPSSPHTCVLRARVHARVVIVHAAARACVFVVPLHPLAAVVRAGVYPVGAVALRTPSCWSRGWR